MRLVVQRVRSASVRVDGSVVGQISRGLLALIGFGRGDGEEDIQYVCDKLLGLRIFEDEQSHMNRSLLEVGGELLIVSQFTLYGDCRKGRRPSFDAAEEPRRARQLYSQAVEYLRRRGLSPQEGLFGAKMEVQLVNDGPVTLMLDSRRGF
ncbi:MAG: D-tyrosyl-tRNA(Tyr) deacylase [Planctomycetes bacterium]|nr:D-tyrosyl-tRNA(Tyr) deacylase [Planctomycetota bacterium]